MTRGGRRRLQAGPTVQRGTSRAMVLDRTAKLVRAELRRCQLDLAPVATLSPMLGVSDETLRAAVGRDPDLGVCGCAGHPRIWSLPPGPVTAGFEPAVDQNRLVLVLPGSAANPHPLLLSGRQLGPVGPAHDDPGGPGRGELGHTITRLYRMAARWMVLDAAVATSSQRSRLLFELIATTWRSDPSVQWLDDRLRIHQVGHDRPIANRFWDGGGFTDRLELVVWTGDDGRHQLVNVYPGGTHGALVGMEATG